MISSVSVFLSHPKCENAGLMSNPTKDPNATIAHLHTHRTMVLSPHPERALDCVHLRKTLWLPESYRVKPISQLLFDLHNFSQLGDPLAGSVRDEGMNQIPSKETTRDGL